MKKQILFDLASMPKMVLVVTLVVMLGTLFGATSYLLKIPKTDLSIINPVVETQCEIDSDCELVYVGSDVCPPCDVLSEEYQCLNKNEAKKVRDEWINKFNTDLYIACSPCEVESDRYVCECENGKCEKVKEKLAEGVVITTDKMEYEHGENVKIIVENNLDKAINYFVVQKDCVTLPYTINQLLSGEKMTKMAMLPFVPTVPTCTTYNDTGILLYERLNVGESVEFIWNQKLLNHVSGAVQTPNGKYRVSITYTKFGEVKESPGEVYSNNFTIKEKSALDARCGEKVKGIGDCSMKVGDNIANETAEIIGRVGYEFNSITEKCVKKVVGGCSFEIPFETLEECQEVCENKECAKEGELINYPAGTNENLSDVCCEGLKGLAGFGIHKNGECEQLIGGPFLTCMPCGNGICESINNFEENKCNCPEDCEGN